MSDLRATLLDQLTKLLDGGEAHVRFDDATSNLPFNKQGIAPANLPYSAWQLLEHLRIAQHDILEFSDNADNHYKSMAWPDDYWPKNPAPPNETAWQHSIDQIRADRKRFEALLQTADLITPFPWGQGQTLLREAFLIADHNSYHLGELIAVRRLLNEWKPA
ncbi:DinB family protein [Terriglobus sp.]|uniref:DinB family protein n=1 Tax=Terriglobus sp. TaxID=1889013 RepID=UPI003B00F5E9